MVSTGGLRIGDKSADGTIECVGLLPPKRNTVRVTIRTTGTDDGACKAFAVKAAPSSGLSALAELYSSFTSGAYLYATYVIVWR